MHLYRARNPRRSPLWQCAHRHFATFVEIYPQEYQPRLGPLRPVIPQIVRKFLDCGNLDRGFARLRCDHCRHEYLLAFSCKSRWFCPSCHQKNVQITAALLTARVLAHVPHRHYVLAIPKMLRPYCQRHRSSSGWRPEAVGWPPMRNHTKLRAFELADQLALAIYKETRSFPREEMFG